MLPSTDTAPARPHQSWRTRGCPAPGANYGCNQFNDNHVYVFFNRNSNRILRLSGPLGTDPVRPRREQLILVQPPAARGPVWANQYSSGHINCHDCVDGTNWIVGAAGSGLHRRGSRPRRRWFQREKHQWVLVITATTADALVESSHSKTASLLLEKCAQVSLELTHWANSLLMPRGLNHVSLSVNSDCASIRIEADGESVRARIPSIGLRSWNPLSSAARCRWPASLRGLKPEEICVRHHRDFSPAVPAHCRTGPRLRQTCETTTTLAASRDVKPCDRPSCRNTAAETVSLP